MKHTTRSLLASSLVATVVVAILVTSAGADQVGADLARARSDREAKLVRLAELQGELRSLLARYRALERQAGHASIDLLEASVAAQDAEEQLAAARADLDAKARLVYEIGPGGPIQALLSADSFADVFALGELTTRALSADAEDVAALEALAARSEVGRIAAERARLTLAPRQRQLTAMLADLQVRLDEAQRLSDEAGVAVARLEQQRRRIAEAATREVGRGLLVGGDVGTDQRALLALLGPSGGRGCDIPPGLLETGKSFSGYASWYGWEFGGDPTATGAIFDPRLFTAANRWLPFGTFLRVHYRGSCAIVLVNDRGPYGRLERVIDLSMAAAQYLGVGVSYVTADILVPLDGLPD